MIYHFPTGGRLSPKTKEEGNNTSDHLSRLICLLKGFPKLPPVNAFSSSIRPFILASGPALRASEEVASL